VSGTGLPIRPIGALLSGLLFVLLFPAPDLGWLAWVSLIPLLLAIDGQPPRAAFRLGYLTGLVAFGGTLLWMRLFTVAAWLLVTVIAAAYIGAFAAGVRLLAGARRGVGLWVVPVSWVAIEVIRSVGPIGFPWVLLGLSQHRTPLVLPMARIIGVFGLSGVIVLVNALGAHVLARRRLTAGAAAVCLLLIAAFVLAHFTTPVVVADSGPNLTVAALQPNVPPMARVDPAVAPLALSGLLALTAQARRTGAELIVYPESAVPADLAAMANLRESIARAADGAVVVAGSLMSGPRNGLVVLDAQGGIIGRYAKRRLVPFGEAGILPGEFPPTVVTPVATIGLAICYESAHPFMIRSAASGADVIALLTNDGWFGRSSGPAQHAAHAVMRAVENGRSLIRAANTGTSMIIWPDGRVAGSLPEGRHEVLAAAVPVGMPATPYVRWGWLMGPLTVAVWLGAAAPRAIGVLRSHATEFLRLAAAILVPGIVWLAGRAAAFDEGLARWLVIAVMLGAVAALGRRHLFRPRGTLVSAGLSIGFAGLLVAVMRMAYEQYGLRMPVVAPVGGWVWGGLQMIAGGIALEGWLRGAVFGSATRIGGSVLGAVISTIIGILAHWGLPQEIVYWHLVTGLAFSVIRARTGDAVGLGIGRGLGDAAVMSLAGLR
jgi:apolipoprotein N-acyltransferase